MLRKVLIGLGVLVAVLVIGVIALVTLVDVNKFKPQIEQAVRDQYQRKLSIDGDLSLKVFPRIGVALPKTTLSEHGSEQTFASLDSARVSVALLPLLQGRIEASKISINGLNATLARRADGSTNFDDLLKSKDTQAAAAKPNEPKDASNKPAQFEIGGIELANANLTWRDDTTKNTVSVKALNLNTGRLATQSRSPIELSTQFSSQAPAANGELKLKGTLLIDLINQAFGTSGLDTTVKATLDKQPLEARVQANELAFNQAKQALSVNRLTATAQGPLGADRFESSLDVPQIEITQSTAAGDNAQLRLNLSGTQTMQLQLTLDGLSGSAQQLNIKQLALTANSEQNKRKLAARLTGAASASLNAQRFALPQFAGDITIDDPALPQKTLKLPLTGSFDLDALKELLNAKLDSKSEETQLTAEVSVKNFKTPQVAFNLNADKLDLDRYFPKAPASAAHSQPATQASANNNAPADQEAKIDLSALNKLALNGEAKIGQLQVQGIKTSNLRVVLKAAGGKLDIAPLTASLYGGSVNAQASVNAQGNRLTSNATLSNVNINPLMKDAIDKDLLEGRGNLKLDVATSGATVSAMKKALSGNGSLVLRDGAVKGINIAQKLRDARALLSGGGSETKAANTAEKTDFSELTASFVVKEGIAQNNDLEMKSPLLRVAGAGNVNIAAGTLDYTVRASVVGTLKGQDGRELNELRGVTVPVRLSGPFNELSYRIDWGNVAQDALKSRLGEQLKNKLGGKTDEPRQRIEDRARDALKGLLGR